MLEPLHPLIVHLPIAISFILPVLIVVFAQMIRNSKMSPGSWLVIIGLQLVVTISGYVSLETGETEEQKVEKVISRKLISEHEEASESFVGSSVLALVLSVGAFFIRKEFQFSIKIGVGVLSRISAYLAFATGKLGGELVYKHGAATAYVDAPGDPSPQGLLPTPGQNTSESPMPVDESDSLKKDDNDYGRSDEYAEPEDEGTKIED